MIGRVLSLALVTMLFACSAGPNTQYLPIGQRCTQDDNCGTSPFDCDSTKPGGYCEEPCTADGACPTDSICLGKTVCRRKCATNVDCRQTEGYACVAKTADSTSSYCDVASGS